MGVKLADKLGIPFYDKELISMAADDINIAEEAFRHYDEHIVVYDPLDRQYYHAFSDVYQIPMSDQIFVAQSNVIRRLTSHGPCIIVGRCADMILTDSLNIFIYAKMKYRIKRMLELESEAESDGKEMERRIREVDRKRKEYYQYYTATPGDVPRITICAWTAVRLEWMDALKLFWLTWAKKIRYSLIWFKTQYRASCRLKGRALFVRAAGTFLLVSQACA